MVFPVSLYTVVFQNSILSSFLQCNQEYSSTFGIEEIPVCLNRGFCADFGKTYRTTKLGQISKPECLCSDEFFGPNCQYRVSLLKPRRVLRQHENMEVKEAENHDIDKESSLVKINGANELVVPGISRMRRHMNRPGRI